MSERPDPQGLQTIIVELAELSKHDNAVLELFEDLSAKVIAAHRWAIAVTHKGDNAA